MDSGLILPSQSNTFHTLLLLFSNSWSEISIDVHKNNLDGVKLQVAGVRSTLWPGAFSVANGKSFSNLYVGWGLKNTPFVPLPPPPIAAEFDQTLMESTELPPKPSEEKPEEEEES